MCASFRYSHAERYIWDTEGVGGGGGGGRGGGGGGGVPELGKDLPLLLLSVCRKATHLLGIQCEWFNTEHPH